MLVKFLGQQVQKNRQQVFSLPNCKLYGRLETTCKTVYWKNVWVLLLFYFKFLLYFTILSEELSAVVCCGVLTFESVFPNLISRLIVAFKFMKLLLDLDLDLGLELMVETLLSWRVSQFRRPPCWIVVPWVWLQLALALRTRRCLGRMTGRGIHEFMVLSMNITIFSYFCKYWEEYSNPNWLIFFSEGLKPPTSYPGIIIMVR